MLTDKIGRLVKERVEIETAELRNTVTTLQAENKKLTDAITELEVKFSTRIDDLEQYGRRPCLQIEKFVLKFQFYDEVILTDRNCTNRITVRTYVD